MLCVLFACACVACAFACCFGAFYPLGLVDCDEQIDGDDDTKFISAMCQLGDGLLDDIIFNIITVILIVNEGSSAFTWMSVLFSLVIIGKRFLLSYYNFVHPLQKGIFSRSLSRKVLPGLDPEAAEPPITNKKKSRMAQYMEDKLRSETPSPGVDASS